MGSTNRAASKTQGHASSAWTKPRLHLARLHPSSPLCCPSSAACRCPKRAHIVLHYTLCCTARCAAMHIWLVLNSDHSLVDSHSWPSLSLHACTHGPHALRYDSFSLQHDVRHTLLMDLHAYATPDVRSTACRVMPYSPRPSSLPAKHHGLEWTMSSCERLEMNDG